jgi:parallel beta-helix repeat protein
MKKQMKRMLFAIAFVIFTMIGSGIGQRDVSAAETVIVSTEDTSDTGWRRAIQKALDEARDNASAKNPYTVKIPKGTYTLDAQLSIYSYTTLDLTGVTLKRADRKMNILRVGLNDTASTGVTGYYYRNITIKGGTLDGCGTDSTVLKAAHCANFTMKKVTLKNVKDGHLMEVGGVNGLTISGCTFKDQTLSSSDVLTYEAVQLDILYEKHLSGTRNEAIPNKNVTVTDCTFQNVPRGIGSHTAVLNAPVNGVTITGCTFKKIKSCAIQGQGWKNVLIEDNTIKDGPRGIAIYYVRDEGSGTYLASVLSKTGKTKSSVSNAYKADNAQNIVIRNNNITLSNMKDAYASYVRGAIVISGTEVTSDKGFSDGSGHLPKGDYYISDVTVTGNTITTYGNGIRAVEARNCTISNNTITCKKATVKDNSGTQDYYGIQARYLCKDIVIKDNTVTGSSSNGIYASADSSIKEISKNTVSNAGKNGIDIEASKCTVIKDNQISNSAVTGIFVYSKSNVDSITNNTIDKAANHGISIYDQSKTTKVSGNTVKSAAGYGICVGNKSNGGTISGNKISGCKKGNAVIAKDSTGTIK